MKQVDNYQRAVNYLVRIFKAANSEYFGDSLEVPTITIQSSVGAYGHISTSKVWSNGDRASYEMNLSADYLTRPIENVVATVIHESVHLYCLMNNIKDTSNRGIYHNSRFKEIAEEMGHLIIDKHEKYGWTITSPSEDTLDFCIKYGFDDIKIGRLGGYAPAPAGGNSTPNNNDGSDKPVKPKKPSSTRKYICPNCGNSFRATKELRVLCMDCNVQFIVA